MLRRAALLWLLLFAAYAGTVGINAFGSSNYGGDEPHYLLTAESIVSDGDVDLTDEYRTRAYAEWYPDKLDPDGEPTAGRLHEPHGVGFPLLIAPAYAIGGPVLVELFLAALAALGFVAAWLLARRLVPEPWAIAGRARLRAVAAGTRLRQRRLPRPRRRRRARLGRALGAGAARPAARAVGVRGGTGAGGVAVAGDEVRRAGDRRRTAARALGAAARATAGGARHRRDDARLDDRLRDPERGAVRGSDPVRGGRRGPDADRRELPRRLPGAAATARFAVARSRLRAAPLGHRYSRLPSSPAGCCGGHGGSGWRRRCPSGSTWRSRQRCCSASAERR